MTHPAVSRQETRKLRKLVARCTLVAASLGVLAASGEAAAFPGFFAGKDDQKRVNLSTQVVLMMKDGKTSVTILPDYDGPMKGTFVMVVPVPDDVTLDYVKSMKRDPVDHLDNITAPRFHEFWEKDPCEAEPQIQEWERDLRVKGAGFLGGAMPQFDESKKAPKEMGMDVEPSFKDGEYVFTLVPAGESATKWLGEHGYKAPGGAEEALKRYSGMQTLIVEVDTNRIELTGKGAILSPFRYTTAKDVKVNSTLGLVSSPGTQELIIYTIHPKQRFEVKNYKNVFAPTNLHVDFKVKERMGEFYAGMYDLIAAKTPGAFVTEFAWTSDGCGQPCPNEPILLNEKLTLGADYFESFVPEEEKTPEPPELTDQEKERIKIWKEAKTKEEKKEAKEEMKAFEEMRKEVARRKALISRHDYVLSRVHYRYDKAGMPQDIELAPAGGVVGGIETPKGPKGELPTDVKTGGDKIQFQTRYTHLHPNIKVVSCPSPEHHRWGIPPITYRGYRKVWTAQDLATKSRTSHKPAALVATPYPALGLAGIEPAAAPGAAAPAGAEANAEDKEKDDGFCAFSPGGTPGSGLRGSLAALGLASLLLGRRRSRKGPIRSRTGR